MQDGLHVGVAAWIDAQRDSDGFIVWPAMPIAAQPVDLEAVQTLHDLARAAEFARLVNFIPRKGSYATPFADDGVLWETHRELLGRMQFAHRAWTDREDAQWKEARTVLYEAGADGLPVLTREYQLYDEFRVAYDELQAAGRDPIELAAAHTDWIVSGFKLEVETALATINRLARRSSLPQAEAERLSLEQDGLPATANGSYAATTFSPLSAVRQDTWLSAEVTVDELDLAVGSAEPRDKWVAWRALRTGSVQFRYAILDLLRHWYSPGLYEADDWRLERESIASHGDGIGGELPAYVRSLYVVSIDEVRTTTSTPTRVPGRLPVHEPLFGAVRPRPVAAATRHLSAAAAPRGGVIAAVDAVHGGLPRPERVSASMLAGLTRRPGLETRTGVFGRLQRVGIRDVGNRVAVAEALLAARERRRPPPDRPPPAGETYVVGFGCAAVPTSPVPNPAYQWHNA